MPPTSNDESLESPVRILHLEDSEVDHALVQRALLRSELQFTIVRVETLDEFRDALALKDIDALGFKRVGQCEAVSVLDVGDASGARHAGVPG